MELAWPPHPSASRYQVLVKDVTEDRYVVNASVKAPRYDLRAEQLKSDHLHRWRVQMCAHADGIWSGLLPELLLPAPPARPAGEESRLRTAVGPPTGPGSRPLRWTDTGAAAYRVIIRDDDVKAVVAQDAVQGTEYAVDWSQLEPQHRLRYRIQAYQDGKWVDQGSYRILHPPLEHAMVPDWGPRPGPAAVSFTHIVLTRFSLRSSGVGFHGEWEPGWLERRLELFERYCLPSMHRQSCQNFTWVIFCDPITPRPVVERLRAQSERIRVASCRLRSHARPHPGDLRDLARFIDPASEVVITTRLDSDDALNVSALAQIQRYASTFWESDDEALVHTFPLGCKLDTVNGHVYRSRYEQNAFLTLFERGENDVLGSLSANHTRLERAHPVVRDFSLLGWLQVLHGGNVSNEVNKNDLLVDGELDVESLFGVTDAGGTSSRTSQSTAGGSASSAPA
jgi:hypothetical protein